MDEGSTVDRERGMAALEATRTAYAAGRVLIVHYECGMIGEGEAVPAHAIAVKDLAAGRPELFSARDGEAEALAGFVKFVESHKNWCWLHWNMRSAVYGFEHIQERIGQCCRGKRFSLPENRADLGLAFWQVYGDMPHGERGKLHGLCDANGVTTANALAGSDIQHKVKAGQWPAVEASAIRKVEMIQAIWCRMIDSKLRLDSGQQGKNAAKPQNLFTGAAIAGAFHVSLPTLRRAIRDGRLTDYRLPEAPKNAQLILDPAEAAKHWRPRKRK